MKEGQDAIYTISGDDIDTLLRSPQLEGFKAKGVEVLLLTDPVDEFWMPSVGVYNGKPFKSVTRGGADLGKIKGEEAEKPEEKAPSRKYFIAASWLSSRRRRARPHSRYSGSESTSSATNMVSRSPDAGKSIIPPIANSSRG